MARMPNKFHGVEKRVEHVKITTPVQALPEPVTVVIVGKSNRSAQAYKDMQALAESLDRGDHASANALYTGWRPQ